MSTPRATISGFANIRHAMRTLVLPNALFALLVGVMISVSGCSSSAGTDFRRPDPSTLQLGKTTEREIRDRFGEPRGEGSLVRNGARVKTLSYAYAEATPYVEKVPARAVVFSFYEGVLVGHDYTSSFSGDKTDFDDSSVARIKSGETSSGQVIDMLGKPTGEFVHPLVKAKDGRAYVYTYSRTDKGPIGGKLQDRRKTLIVTFDAAGLVTDVNLTTDDSK
jgi:hypothetical protein